MGFWNTVAGSTSRSTSSRSGSYPKLFHHRSNSMLLLLLISLTSAQAAGSLPHSHTSYNLLPVFIFFATALAAAAEATAGPADDIDACHRSDCHNIFDISFVQLRLICHVRGSAQGCGASLHDACRSTHNPIRIFHLLSSPLTLVTPLVREGLLVCSGDRVVGVVGGGMDEFSALLLRNMMKGAEQHQLPPGLRNMTKGAVHP